MRLIYPQHFHSVFALMLQMSELQYPGKSGRHCKGQNQGSKWSSAWETAQNQLPKLIRDTLYLKSQVHKCNMGNNLLNKQCSGKGECFYLSHLKVLEKNPYAWDSFTSIYSTSHAFYMTLINVYGSVWASCSEQYRYSHINDDSFWKHNWVRIYPCIKTVTAVPAQFCRSFVSALTSSEAALLAHKIMFNLYI